MKTLREFLTKVFFFTVLISLGACAGNEEPDGVEEMSAGVEGELFTLSEDFDTAFGRKIPITRVKTDLTIQGTNNIGKGFVFKISPYEGTGTYLLGPASKTEHLATWINDSKDLSHYTTGFEGTMGKIVVTEDLGNKLVGTFEFTAKSSETSQIKRITFGTFKINLQ